MSKYLQITKNSLDISGKTFRETETILANELPDLSKSLIASTIILSQGMPQKFSSFSPSGRKELLEKLTKSDFMIEDIRTRVGNRQQVLTTQQSEQAGKILVAESQLAQAGESLKSYELEHMALLNQSFDQEIFNLTADLTEVTKKLSTLDQQTQIHETEIDSINTQLIQLSTDKTNEYLELNTAYNRSIEDLVQDQNKLNVEIRVIQTEITRIKNIKDICPTCGQRIPNVEKPDTTAQEQLLAEKQVELAGILKNLADKQEKYNVYLNNLEQKFSSQELELQKKLFDEKQETKNLKNQITQLQTDLSNKQIKLAATQAAKENFEHQITELLDKIEQTKKVIENLDASLKELREAQATTEAHLIVLKKMETLIKRDFRGYVLIDIIKYIETCAKEFCRIIFGTTELSLTLNGNALDIVYAGKNFDLLSGGEKQRVDLILQFAIRELLQKYLGYQSNILVLDEIFDGMDKKSTSKTIELITDKLQNIDSIFVISHHANELEIPVDSYISVVKDESGVSSIY